MTVSSEAHVAKTSTTNRLQQSIIIEEDFLKNMRHELRTPIHSVLGFVDLLSGQFFGELNEKQLHYVKQIESNTSYLLFLLNSLFDILKIDFNEMALELTAVPAENFINTAVSTMGDPFTEKGVTTEISIEPNLPPVIADIKKCEQIMANVVSIILKNSSPEDKIIFSARQTEGAYAIISVSNITIAGADNNGINQHSVKTNKEGPANNGNFDEESVRFALTRRLVKLHGGKIGVDYTSYPKSSIWFTLRQKMPTLT